MNEQKKVTLPGSISNIPTTNYARAYSIVSTWAHHYTPDEMKRLLIGRGVDISDIDVEAMHKACTASLEGLTAPAGTVEVTYEDGTKESRSSSLSMMQPKTPEEQENAWTERKRGLILAVLERHRNDPAKLEKIESLTQHLFSKDRSFSERGRDMTELCDLLGVNTLNEDPAWSQFKEQALEAVPGMHRPVPNRMLGESEFSRPFSGLDVIHRGLARGYHLNAEQRGALGIGGPLDFDNLAGSEPDMESVFASYMRRHIFHNYTPEYLRQRAIERKAKRLKNQRRRRNAKARRK